MNNKELSDRDMFIIIQSLTYNDHATLADIFASILSHGPITILPGTAPRPGSNYVFHMFGEDYLAIVLSLAKYVSALTVEAIKVATTDGENKAIKLALIFDDARHADVLSKMFVGVGEFAIGPTAQLV